MGVCEVGEGRQQVQTSNYRKSLMGSSCAAWQLQLIILFYKLFCIFESCLNSRSKKSSSHTHTRCKNVRWWTCDRLIMVMISQYIQILSLNVAHPKWIWRDMSTMHQLKKRNGGRTICALTIAEKDEALSFASGSAVFPPLSDVKDTYGLGCSDGIGLGFHVSHKLPGNDSSCRPLAVLWVARY